MGCFLVPMTLGIATAILAIALHMKDPNGVFQRKMQLGVLNLLLWGGVVMLLVDHLASGELVPYPPFLTSGIEVIMPELLGVGVPMTIAVLSVWATYVVFKLYTASSEKTSA